MSSVTQDRPTLSPWKLGPQQTLPELSPERRRYEVALRERARRSLLSTRSAAVKAQPAAVKAQPAAVKAQPAAVKAQPAAVKAQPAAVKAQPAQLTARMKTRGLTEGLDLFEFTLDGEEVRDAAQLNRLGERLERGEGCFEDLERARGCYERAAAQGYGPALFNLGQLAFFGWGGAADLKLALRCFKSASKRGVAEASFQLATLYERGQNLQQNLNAARDLYQLALAQGCWGAAAAFEQLNNGAPRNAEAA